MFWMPLPSGPVGQKTILSATEPSPGSCNAACRDEIRRLEPYDAFATLMMTLAQRLRWRKAAVADATILGQPVDVGAQDVLAATAWSRLEDEWQSGLLQGPRQQLRSARWRTPAASCEGALAVDD